MAEPLSGMQGHNGGPLGDAKPEHMNAFLGRYENYLDERKAVNKAGKDLRKDIEKAGIPLPAWDQFVKLREEPGVVRERNDIAYRQLMAWDLKPVGVQAAMDLSAGARPDLNVHELQRVDKEGFATGKAGKGRELNPFTPGTEAYQKWDSAWVRGQAEIAETLQSTGNDNGRPRRGRPPGSGKNQRAAREAAKDPPVH